MTILSLSDVPHGRPDPTYLPALRAPGYYPVTGPPGPVLVVPGPSGHRVCSARPGYQSPNLSLWLEGGILTGYSKLPSQRLHYLLMIYNNNMLSCNMLCYYIALLDWSPVTANDSIEPVLYLTVDGITAIHCHRPHHDPRSRNVVSPALGWQPLHWCRDQDQGESANSGTPQFPMYFLYRTPLWIISP